MSMIIGWQGEKLNLSSTDLTQLQSLMNKANNERWPTEKFIRILQKRIPQARGNSFQWLCHMFVEGGDDG